MTALVWKRAWNKALIPVRSERSSTEAAAATRVGDSMPDSPAEAALKTYSGQIRGPVPTVELSARAALQAAMASSATSKTLRRSYVSAIAPPTKEHAISGTS